MNKIDEIKNKNPFKVPENYFEEVNRSIISATCGNNEDVIKAGLFTRFRPYLLIAASVTGFVLLSYSAIRLLVPDKANIQVSEVLNTEYSQSYLNDIDINSLEQSASLVLEEAGPDVSNTDIIDYLLMENIEILDIYEQL